VVSRIDMQGKGVVERPVQERLHLLIESLADAAHLRLGDATDPAQRLNQEIDLEGGDANEWSIKSRISRLL
jgi:hypothetical protein